MTRDWAYEDRRDGGIRTNDVCRLAGITYRQLDYWTRTKLIWPSMVDANGSGSARRWSREDVAYIRLIRELLAVGLDLARVRTASRELRLAVDTRLTAPYFVLTTSTARSVTLDDLVDVVAEAPSSVVLNLDEVCALDPDHPATTVA